MPRRGSAPGLKRGRHRLPYWIASQVARDTMGFPDRCIPLPPDADDEMLAQLCREHTARLHIWIAQASVNAKPANSTPTADNDPSLTKTRYDGTVLSVCRIYQEHPLSPFHGVKHNTRRTYTKDLKRIELTVGSRLLRNVTVIDVKHWYDQWRKGVETIDIEGNKVVGPERIDRAHDSVAMFRTVIYFCAALRFKECKLLAEELKLVKFEKGGAREQELTYQQATAFIKTALEMGRKGTMPADRALAMAIGTAAQFELLLRQMDIIGEWAPTTAKRKIPAGMSTVLLGAETWSGFFTWEHIPGWRWRMKTSKSKYRAAADFDLTRYGLLHPLLEAIPHDQRTGAIVKGESGLPVRQSSYGKWFRKIARAADIPDDIQNMDARAGGATEAEESGAAIEQIQAALTHSKAETTLRYIRRRTTKIAAVADARSLKRAADNEGGGNAGT